MPKEKVKRETRGVESTYDKPGLYAGLTCGYPSTMKPVAEGSSDIALVKKDYTHALRVDMYGRVHLFRWKTTEGNQPFRYPYRTFDLESDYVMTCLAGEDEQQKK